MTKILSRSGVSLADTYDVQGSIAGVEELRSEEVTLVHEMGATIHSERMSSFIRRMTTAAILQSIEWDIVIDDLPRAVWRVLGVSVLADVVDRVNFAQVSLRSDGGQREIPIFVWDSADATRNVRIVENGGASANLLALVPVFPVQQTPNIGINTGQPQRVGDIAFRGKTLAFGAGTITVIALIHLAFADTGSGLRPNGLPLPGW